VAGLERLINEATLLELTHGPNSPRYIELQKLISVQKRLVRTKLKGNPIFDRLGILNVSTYEA
jgi:hypothetical protein